MPNLTSSFKSPDIKPHFRDLSNDLEEVYELVDHVEVGPSGEATDFIVRKKPVKVDEYHLNKVIAERVKGADLGSIIAQCERTGDYSTLNQRKVIFGDGVLTPTTIGDAVEAAEKGAQILDGMTKDEIKHYYDLSKLSKEELSAYISDEVEKRLSLVKSEEKKGEEK